MMQTGASFRFARDNGGIEPQRLQPTTRFPSRVAAVAAEFRATET